MRDRPFWRMPPGPERKAAKQRYFTERTRLKPIPAASLRQVMFNGQPAWQGPSRVAHTFTNEAEEEIAKRLARTYAPPFPHDVLTAVIHDGQLLLACKTRDYRFPIPLDLDVPPFLFTATIDHLREAELEHLATMAQAPNEAATFPNPGDEPERTLHV